MILLPKMNAMQHNTPRNGIDIAIPNSIQKNIPSGGKNLKLPVWMPISKDIQRSLNAYYHQKRIENNYQESCYPKLPAHFFAPSVEPMPPFLTP